MARARLNGDQKQLLGELYQKCARTVDDLPYTADFESLYAEFIARSAQPLTMHEVWNALTDCRKRGRLVHKRKRREPAGAS